MRQYNGYYDTDGLGWHFDRSEFGVNLVLQAPSSRHQGMDSQTTHPHCSPSLPPLTAALSPPYCCCSRPRHTTRHLLPQEPSSGGDFDYHRLTRSEADPWAYAAVGDVLRTAAEARGGAGGGAASAASAASAAERVAGVAAGSLVFFAGRLSLHRVSPVHGPRPRINAILTYEKEPGQLANPCPWLRCRTPARGRSVSLLTLWRPPRADSLEKFFGRTAAEQQALLQEVARGGES